MLNLYRFILWFVFWVAGNFAYLMADSYTQTSDYADAWLLNETISTSGVTTVEKASVRFNRLYLNAMTRKSMGIDMYGVMYYPGQPLANAAELNALAGIALKCPTTFGRAVHKARALRAFIEGFPRLYEDSCENTSYNSGAKMAQDEETQKLGEILLYPNPAKNEVTVEIAFKGKVEMKAFTLTGQKVAEASLAGESFHTLDTSGWAAGVYTLQFSGDGYRKNVKLVIVK